ncbi:MAG: NTP transferase domain-containing protein [Propionicimonas sp.]|uniref:sugar phosphate nucleotidyltransferase n=1 Tax=Propionicimonas sp. TaxID=1955623 RepID=UPI002B1F644C|nr:sugar phosphate nucleotidyltransferase [Propionicimonas sp.]MEA4945109.1 NTP transferase domain-containing protein [Propionicimonas sp.]MEA5054528.1 NTP transferase domain-containing protein [Propionicimonas sp.]MEA5119412.1 NTP transferase domain-containing protein [Propionicimonas sp.]
MNASSTNPAPAGARPCKAVVLAAGHDEATRDLLLRPLAGSSVLEQTLANVTAVVPRQDVIIVVAEHDPAVREYLGEGWNYVVQTVQAGTGDAVRCARFELEGFDGDVLIAYGDTPLLRSASLRGLLWRHRLKAAQFSLLTAVLEQPLSYGRIERDDAGRIQEIVEATDLSPTTTQITEVNVGAYVVDNGLLIPELDAMAEAGEHRLTELAERLIDQGREVASYAIVDPDEVQGINTDGELQAAADIVLKRLFAPQHAIETGEIAFGTGGWRALIGEGFTIHNVRRLCQAIANEVARRGLEQQGVVIGGDRRFLSWESVVAAAEVFAGNNIDVQVLPDDVPTPLVTFAAPYLGTAYSLIFTASHNPPQWNGLKVFRADGSLPLQDETDAYTAEANSLRQADVVAIDFSLARAVGRVKEIDLTNAYVDAIEQIVDVNVIRSAGLRVIVDAMYGTSQLTLGTILSDARCRTEFIHERHNPLFGGRSPAPDPERLSTLIDMVRSSGRYDLGMATDGDADRIAIIDEQGRYISTNDLLLLVYWYLHEVRGERGGVVRNLATTHLLDRLAESFGEEHREVAVGFKHITAGMDAIGAVLGGESSGGLTVRGHIKGKDGIFACALVVEMLARTGKRLGELLDDVYAITGRLHQVETGVPATPDMRVELPRRMAAAAPTRVAGYPVDHIDSYDGIKIYLEGGAWALLRFSGTEPVLRMFVEAETPQKAAELIAWLEDFASGTGDGSPAR